ncbi:MAG TPA: tRNA (N6-threonylcarbamoyladenosine(37)-N6)-methyltransferase TrmO, partial [Ruminococcaceae bacterium]|nr:tRNA (N6-threonylcarbamoyladenosine(37)-N6)-methyltransferase TrmO [Oscillospiraceae bacterium]
MAELKVIARIYTDFPEKFGLPRQSGVISELEGKIVFEPSYRDFSAVKELCEFSHIWLI